MPEHSQPNIFYLAHRWFPMGIGAVMLVFGSVGLMVALIQGSVGMAILIVPWLAVVGLAVWGSKSLRTEIREDSLRIRWPVGWQTISWIDVTSIQEVDGLGDWRETIAMWRTYWRTLAHGKGVVFHVRRKGRLPNWYNRMLVNVEKHEEFIAALEAVGLTVRKLDSDVE